MKVMKIYIILSVPKDQNIRYFLGIRQACLVEGKARCVF